MDIGAELAQARERAGLTREQVSQETKIQLAKIEALEHNEFERLPDGIYLDGILRVYAQLVRLNPEEVVQEAHAQLGITRAAEATLIAASTDAAPEVGYSRARHVEYVADDYASDAGMDEFQSESGAAAAHAALASRRRVGRVVYPILAVLAAVGLGLYVYASTRPFPPPDSTAVPAIQEATAPNETVDASPADRNRDAGRDTAERTSRAPKILTPAASAAASAKASAAARPPSPAAKPPALPRTSPPPPPQAAAAPPAAATPSRAEIAATAREDELAERKVPSAAAETSAPATSPDVTGSWTFSTRVESAALKTFEGLRLGYTVQLRQNGKTITGTGYKFTENGETIADAGRTPIAIQGTTDGRRLTLAFTEKGTRRLSKGKFVLHVTDDGVLQGRFASDAARSQGTIEARRLNP